MIRSAAPEVSATFAQKGLGSFREEPSGAVLSQGGDLGDSWWPSIEAKKHP